MNEASTEYDKSCGCPIRSPLRKENLSIALKLLKHFALQ